jgi:DNA-binding NarL/FixJ family response regulator
MDARAAPVRVLVVDDHELSREAARAVVAATPGFETVGEAACCTDGLALAGLLSPDLVLLDVDLHAPDWIETARRLVAESSAPLVVLVSTDPECPGALALTAEGAAALVTKQSLRPAVLASVWASHAEPVTRSG